MSDVATLLNTAKTILPSNFIAKESDDKLTAYLRMAADDINYTLPFTSFTLEQMPDTWNTAIIVGASYYASLFLACNYSLKDFGYNDNGLSLQIDRQGKIEKNMQLQLAAFEQMKNGIKRAAAFEQGPAGLGYPRYQSQIGQFLRILFGASTFGGPSG